MSEPTPQRATRMEVLRGAVAEVIGSYESKVRMVMSLMKQAFGRIRGFHQEQDVLANRLKELLAKRESLRKKDFDAMLAGIRESQRQREQGVNQMIEEFCQEEDATIGQLRTIISGPGPSTMEEFHALKEQMLNRPKERERKVGSMMKQFHQDQEELTAALKRLVDKGTAARIKDLKGMVKAVRMDQQGPGREVEMILEEFERVKQAVSTQWERVLATVGTDGNAIAPSVLVTESQQKGRR